MCKPSVKLTVTIVVYGNYCDTKNAIRTLETFTDFRIPKEIYIVDNGCDISEVQEVDAFKKFLEKYEDVHYIRAEKNLGFGRGHNLVLPQLDSKYHVIMNPDILLKEDSLSAIIDYMENNLDVGMCIPNIVDEQGERQHVYRNELTVFDMFIRMFCKDFFPGRIAWHTLQDKDYSKPFQVPFGQGSFLVIRTELLKKLNGFDEKFFMYIEDADLCKRVNATSKLMYYPGTSIVHKWEQGSHKNIKLFKYHLQSMKYYFDKWGWKII